MCLSCFPMPGLGSTGNCPTVTEKWFGLARIGEGLKVGLQVILSWIESSINIERELTCAIRRGVLLGVNTGPPPSGEGLGGCQREDLSNLSVHPTLSWSKAIRFGSRQLATVSASIPDRMRVDKPSTEPLDTCRNYVWGRVCISFN